MITQPLVITTAVGAVLWGLMILGLIHGYRSNEIRNQEWPLAYSTQHFFIGAGIWILANGIPVLIFGLLAELMCADKDDIACGLVIIIPAGLAFFVGNFMWLGIAIDSIIEKNWVKTSGLIFPACILVSGLGFLMYLYP